VEAISQLGGTTVDVRPAYFLAISLFHGAAVITHEALHNLGLNNQQVKPALGLTDTQCRGATDCISVKLEQDCFQPPAAQLLGLP